MALSVFTINDFCSAIKLGDCDALQLFLNENQDVAEDSELMLIGLEKAIEADLGAGTHLAVACELLKYPSVASNIVNEANKILRQAIVMSPCIARKIIELSVVTESLQAYPNCDLLKQTLSVAGFIDQKRIVCEVADKVSNSVAKINYLPSAWDNAPTLLNILGAQRARAQRQYSNYEQIAKRVPSDIVAIIFSFLPKTNHEREAITLEELRKLFPSRPQSLNA